MFRNAEEDELFSIAYIEATDLLKNKYRPVATVSTFLKRYLYGRVEYRYLTKVRGLKRWSNRYECPPPRDGPLQSSGVSSKLEVEELIALLHPDIQPLARAIADGDSIEQVARDNGITTEWLRSVLKRHLQQFAP
jgi:hypothetical protein